MEVEYLPQGMDYLGNLNAKLRDLRGWSTLLYELIQNADDAEGATELTIDVTDQALIVQNNGAFTDCGHVREDVCAWSLDGDDRRRCDFHAFRLVASGHKRLEEGTTGAFGIGFISVYQITDNPELQSGRWHWRMDPAAAEARRIHVLSSTGNYSGTRFEFPWATSRTYLRERLGVEPVPADIVDSIVSELKVACTLASPFLKRLEGMELKLRGQQVLHLRCMRDPGAADLLIESRTSAGTEVQLWRRITGNFDDAAQKLRALHGASIEAKRRSVVTIAVPQGGTKTTGRLYATLPTSHQIELPVLINADFFPSSDRKRILFESDYQGDWNRAAIRAAASALVQNLEQIRDCTPAGNLWAMFAAARQMHREAHSGRIDLCFEAFWSSTAPALRAGRYVWSAERTWERADEARQLFNVSEDEFLLPLLRELRIPVVHPDLRNHTNLLRESDIGVRHLSIDDISDSFHAAGLNRDVCAESVPTWLMREANRARLAEFAERYLGRVSQQLKNASEVRFASCAVAKTTVGRYAPPAMVFLADAGTRILFDPLKAGTCWVADTDPEAIRRRVRRFGIGEALGVLEEAAPTAISSVHNSDPSWLGCLIEWFADRRSEFGSQIKWRERLAALPIWPGGGELYSLKELSVPGGFADPLGLAKLVDRAFVDRFGSFLLEDLNASQLTIHTYLSGPVQRAFRAGELPQEEDTRAALLALMAQKLGEFRDDQGLLHRLGALALVSCVDGGVRPAAEVLLPTEINRLVFGASARVVNTALTHRPAIVDLLLALGASERPNGEQIIQRVIEISAEQCDPQSRAAFVALVDGLARCWTLYQEADRVQIGRLQAMRWMPAQGHDVWWSPADVYTTFQSYLFESQGRFIELPVGLQRRSADLLGSLGVRTEPAVELVVDHLLHCARQGSPVNLQVYEFLNRHADSPCITRLRGTPSLFDGQGRYVRPDQAFWSNHPFGQARVRLGDEWRKFDLLLNKLQVREAPVATDAVQVLQEIAALYADRRCLESEHREVVKRCWSFLGSRNEPDLDSVCGLLRDQRVVLNDRGFLKLPSEIMFDDLPGVAEKFGGALASHVIEKPEPAARALAMAGVQSLSQLLSMELVECEGEAPAINEAARLQERWELVRRVAASNLENTIAHVKSCPQLFVADKLTVVYRVYNLSSEAEPVESYLSRQDVEIYFLRGATLKWTHVAKQIAFWLAQDGSAGLMAAAIKDALGPDTTLEAIQTLDALGIARVVEQVETDSGQEVGAFSIPILADTQYPDASDQEEPGRAYNGEVDQPAGPAEVVNTKPVANHDHAVDHSSAELVNNGNSPSIYDSVYDELGIEMPPPGSTEATLSGDEYDDWDGANHGGSVDRPGAHKPTRARPTGHAKRHAILRSFPSSTATDDESAMSEEAKEHRCRIDNFGVKRALSHEIAEGRIPLGMPHENEGYDIESRDAMGTLVRYIEVKSLSDAWNGHQVKLSPAQIRKAQAERGKFWLYVIECAGSSDETLCCIQDPVGKIVEYRFDDGWVELASRGRLPAIGQSPTLLITPTGMNQDARAAQ